MKKSLLLIVSLFTVSLSSFSQAPTLKSYEVFDTLCEYSYYKPIVYVTLEDLEGDSSYIISLSTTPVGYIDDSSYTITYLESTPTTWTYRLDLSSLTVPAGFNNFDLNMTFYNEAVETGTGDIVGLGVYGNIDPVITGPINLCENALPFDLRTIISGTTEYDYFEWDGDYDFNDGYMMIASDYAVAALDALEYSGNNSSGCSMYAYASVNISPVPVYSSGFTNPTACNTPDGTAEITTASGYSPYDVYWSTGKEELVLGDGVTSSVSDLAAGFYYANITDANGCKVVKNFVITDDSDIDIAENITDESCKDESEDGAIDLGLFVDPGTAPITSIYWSNGATTENLEDIHAGEYSVLITTEGGCIGAGTFEVGSLPPLSITTESVTPYDCGSGSAGAIDISTSGGSGAYEWDWHSTGGSSEDFSGPGGVHGCTVTDMTTGCTLTWFGTVSEIGGPSVYVDDFTLPNCGVSNGAVQVSAFPGSGGAIVSYLWTDGSTTEDLTGAASGNYTLTVTDAGGCKGYAFANLGTKKPYQPEICMLTVDSSLTYNQVVWQKEAGSIVEGFNIYRETSTFGEFELVAYRDYALESFYQDNVASPLDRSWRYYMTSVDACDVESIPSPVHKTMHAVANTTDMVNYEISWDAYEGISYSSVNLLRYDDVSGDWSDLGTYAIGDSPVSDIPPSVDGLNYFVEFNLSFPCTSTKATDHNSSRSNKTSSTFNPNGSTLTIEEKDLGVVSVFPNPTSTNFTVTIEKPENFTEIEIINLKGDVIFSTSNLSFNNEIDMSAYAAGLYVIRIHSEEKIITEKITKQ